MEIFIVIVAISFLASITVVSYSYKLEVRGEKYTRKSRRKKHNITSKEHVELVPRTYITKYFKNKKHER